MALKRISCDCGWHATLDRPGQLRLLQRQGHARKMHAPEPKQFDELFEALRSVLRCPECAGGTLQVAAVQIKIAEEEDDELWGGPRRCNQCRRPISRERLDALSETQLCIACATAEGCATRCETHLEDYCERCGSLLTWSTQRSSIQTHKLICTACREPRT